MRNYIIDDFVFEFEFFIFFVRFKFNLNVIELFMIIRLMSEFIFNFCSSVESFMVCYLRSINVCFYFEFMVYMVNDDIKVKFIYISDDSLVSFLVSVSMECWIFFRKFR